MQNGQCNSGKCTIESGQTGLPDLTRVDGGAFNLLSFWFTNTGNGRSDDNLLSIRGFTGDAINGYTQKAGAFLSFTYANLLSSFPLNNPAASVAYAAGASDPGSPSAKTTCMTLIICKNFGYLVTLTGAEFDGVTKVQFRGFTSAQNRLDSIGVETIVQPPAPVPVPAAAWLLLAGIGTLGALRRQKRI